jgi:hypothetical protein
MDPEFVKNPTMQPPMQTPAWQQMQTPQLTQLQWSRQDWERLQQLRAGFLRGGCPADWRNERDLELYEAVFGQRILWKWEAVLGLLEACQWKPRSPVLVDWGCGSGEPSRLVAQWTGQQEVYLHDLSPIARARAVEKHRADGRSIRPGLPPSGDAPFLLVLSHVLGELNEAGQQEILRLASGAAEILWVEPGDRMTSRALGAQRERLRAMGFQMVAPCPHQLGCPVLQPTQDREWCHFFARPPGWIFQSAFWTEIARKLEIDLRSLPYSFLVLSREKEMRGLPSGGKRLLGRAEVRKGEVGMQFCGPEGLGRRRWQKREATDIYRELKRHPEALSGQVE